MLHYLSAKSELIVRNGDNIEIPNETILLGLITVFGYVIARVEMLTQSVNHIKKNCIHCTEKKK